MNNKISWAVAGGALLVILGGAAWVGTEQGSKCKDPSGCPQNVELSAAIDEEALALGVRIVPRALLEDSRCPADVQCIQAGTVRIQADIEDGLGKSSFSLKLGETITTESHAITFVNVLPETKKAGQEVPLVGYRFVFNVEKR